MKKIFILFFPIIFFNISLSAQQKSVETIWRSSIKDLPGNYITIVVSKDGTGDYKTVQEAINAVTNYNNIPTVIFIRNGIYKEKLRLDTSKINVYMVGESVSNTILTYDDFASKKDSSGNNIGTSGSASFFIYGSGFHAENITFQNSAGPVGQAVAVRVTGDRAVFRNCRFLGFHDTLYTHGIGREYYYECYIEGTVDFIFGAATAIFDHCTIFGKAGGFYTTASTPKTRKFGYVFLHCKITGSAPPGSFYLGRPWRPFAKTVFIECEMDKTVKPEGWYNWDNPENEKTAFYAEYKSYGPGANPSSRVSWSKQITGKEAKLYTIRKIFNNWNPFK
ncbi:MAG TPA: pectinesterase family protein [Hanamia sp.]|nr:pectinesterase family protein [Hanamia sp.]